MFFLDLHNPPTRPPPSLPQQTNSGKTSLLFHYAHAVAADGGHAIILLPRPPAEGGGGGTAAAAPAPAPAPARASLPVPLNPPLLAPAAARADAAAWGRVAIKWVSSLADLQAYGACLHLLDPAARPDAVCVDDVGGLPVGGEEAPAVPPGGPEGAPPPPPPPPRPPPDRRAREQALMRALALLADGVGGGWRGQDEGSGGGGGAVAEQWHRPGGDGRAGWSWPSERMAARAVAAPPRPPPRPPRSSCCSGGRRWSWRLPPAPPVLNLGAWRGGRAPCFG